MGFKQEDYEVWLGTREGQDALIRQVVEALGAQDEIADNSTLRGLFLAAEESLEQAQEILDEEE